MDYVPTVWDPKEQAEKFGPVDQKHHRGFPGIVHVDTDDEADRKKGKKGGTKEKKPNSSR